MKLTKAQKALLECLEEGNEVTLRGGYYTIVDSVGRRIERMWPTTFHGLFDSGAVVRQDNGNYVISQFGRGLISK